MRSVFAGLCIAAALLAAPAAMAVETVSSPDMKAIFDADQADRSGDPSKVDWSKIGPRDAERRAQTRQLLADGKLHTGEDYLGAAFVFQHGQGDDYLLAHTLAVIAAQKGAKGGAWIAAATLDRYLQGIGKKQIYGTQMTIFKDGKVTRDPYDPDLISDSLRRELGVPDLAEQAAQLEERKRMMAPQGGN